MASYFCSLKDVQLRVIKGEFSALLLIKVFVKAAGKKYLLYFSQISSLLYLPV